MASTEDGSKAEGIVLPSNYDSVHDNMEYQMKAQTERFASILTELEEMADGGSAGGIREKYYPGWTNEHFEYLLGDLQSTFNSENQRRRIEESVGKFKERADTRSVEDYRKAFEIRKSLGQLLEAKDNKDEQK